MRITCPPILKSPNLSKASLINYSLCNLNRIGDKQHPCLIPLPIFTLFVSPSSSFILNTMIHVNLLINLFRASRCHFHAGSSLILSRLRCQIPSASLRSMRTIPPPCPKFVLISLSAFQFIFLFYTQSDLQVHPRFSFLSVIYVLSLLPLLHV